MASRFDSSTRPSVSRPLKDQIMSIASEIVAVGLATASAIGPMPEMVKDTTKHAPIRGHICGRDNGKDPKKPQKRNAPCSCGSGKKAKKCCVINKEPVNVG